MPKPYANYTDKNDGKDIRKDKYIANCTSYICTHCDVGSVIKNVSIHAIDCPDCQSALFWERVDVIHSL
jgi:hypothetical protein